MRVTPMRRAKGLIGSLKDPESDAHEEEDQLLEDEGDGEENQEEADGETQEEDEVDELISSASITPPPEPRGRRTPVRSRLRPRRPRKKVTPTVDEENEGDDEEEEDVVQEEEDEEEEGEESAAEESGKVYHWREVFWQPM